MWILFIHHYLLHFLLKGLLNIFFIFIFAFKRILQRFFCDHTIIFSEWNIIYCLYCFLCRWLLILFLIRKFIYILEFLLFRIMIICFFNIVLYLFLNFPLNFQIIIIFLWVDLTIFNLFHLLFQFVPFLLFFVHPLAITFRLWFDRSVYNTQILLCFLLMHWMMPVLNRNQLLRWLIILRLVRELRPSLAQDALQFVLFYKHGANDLGFWYVVAIQLHSRNS